MDRPVTYFGQVPRSLDVLTVGQDAMVGLAKLSEAAFGTASAVAGFACTGTTPASLNLVVGPGQVYQVQNLEATTVSGLQVDTHQILKQGINLDPTILTLVPPTTVGFAVNILIEARYADVDTGGIVLTFQNPSVPGQTFQGPGGNGQQANTLRKGIATVQPNYGTPATSGQQTTPAPDAGFVGIAVVTLAYGQTAITSTNIAPYNGNASYIPTTLTGVPAGVLSGAWTFGTASGTNAYAATLFSTAAYPFALTAGMEILVYFANANTTTTPTFNANGTGAKSIVKQGGSAPAAGDLSGFMPLVWDSTNWRVNELVASDVNNFVAPHAGRLIAVQTFTSSGTYTPSTGMTYIVVEGVGGGAAGGGAGGATSTFVSLGAPGTASCYGRAFYTAAQIGASQTVTIGAGGAPVSGGVGGNGGQTYFGSLLGLPGGVGGNTLTNQTAPTVNGNGSTSAAGTGANITQTPGGVSSVSTAYTSSVGSSGQGGNSLLGTGGIGVFVNATAAAATGFGAGGGTVIVNASGGTLFGGAGSGGKLIITEYGY